jgi:hypothetical protein
LILFFDDHLDLFMPFKEALLVPLQPKKWKREKFENCQKKFTGAKRGQKQNVLLDTQWYMPN